MGERKSFPLSFGSQHNFFRAETVTRKVEGEEEGVRKIKGVIPISILV